MKRRPHVHTHDHKKHKTEYGRIEEVEKVKTGGSGGKKQKNARTSGAAGIQEDRKGDPVHEALDDHGDVHEYHSGVFPIFAVNQNSQSNRCHHGTEECEQANRRNAMNIIINTQIEAEQYQKRVYNDGL